MIAIIEFTLFVIGALLAVAGDRLQMPLLLYSGMSMVGLVVLLSGLEAIVTRKMKWYRDRYYAEHYSGVAAISMGILLSLGGLALMAYAIAAYLGREQVLIDLLLSRFGIFIFLLSLVYFLRGLAASIGYNNPAATLNDRVAKGFDRFMGFASLQLGLVGMGIGGFQVFFPEMFSSLMRSLFQFIMNLIF